MGRKRRIRELRDALAPLFSDLPGRKELRKKKHLRALIETLERRRGELEDALEGGGTEPLEDIAEDLGLVAEQLGKARALLEKLEG